MELPPLTSVHGAYWYFISLLLLLVAGSAVYLAAMVLGYAPDPTRLF